METILENLRSPFWWFTVVAGGILLHVVAIRLDAGGSKLWMKLSARRTEMSKILREGKKARVELMISKPRTIPFYMHRANFFRHSATFLVLVATVFIVGAAYLEFGILQPGNYRGFGFGLLVGLTWLGSGVCIMLGMFAQNRANDIDDDIEKAVREKDLLLP